MFRMRNPPSDFDNHQESNDASPPRIAWFVVALLVPVALLNYLDRQMLAAMKSSMMNDIPDIATRANWGVVLGSFTWVYALLSPAGGYLADRLSRSRVIAASLFVWSVVTWATGHVQSFPQLVAARALMGISEALYIPAALALVAQIHRGGTRSRAIGHPVFDDPARERRQRKVDNKKNIVKIAKKIADRGERRREPILTVVCNLIRSTPRRLFGPGSPIGIA